MASRTYELAWSYEPRLATEHLGRSKYSTSTKAIAELVANALAAGDRVDVDAVMTDLGGIQSIVVSDRGHGMTSEELQERFVRIGVRPDEKSPSRLGRFGVGRLAVHRVGGISEWVTVAVVSKKRVRSSFRLEEGTEKSLKILEEEVGPSVATGTTIRIFNLVDAEEPPTPTKIRNELLSQFCAYLLGNPNKQICVQGERVDVEALIAERKVEVLAPQDELGEVTLTHVTLKKVIEQSRFSDRILFSAKGRTVHASTPEDLPSPQYLGIVECAFLDEVVSSNRETLIQLDGKFRRLEQHVLDRVEIYGRQQRALQSNRFLERARKEAFYPFNSTARDAVSNVKQVIYDAMLDKVNEHAQVEKMTKRQQALVFRLLNRAMANQNLLDVMEEIASLSDDDIKRFREVLERTTLESIVRLSSEVTERLRFLDVLHELVYGDNAKFLKERSQLHKILEPNCWLFGPKFHLAASDKSFREVVRRHREIAELAPSNEQELQAVAGIADIPDLFLAGKRGYPVEPRNQHLLVEIKAPNVDIGPKQIQQVERYGRTVLASNQFDKLSTQWELYVVSAHVTEDAEFDRTQKDRPYGCVRAHDRMTIWAYSWAEVISKARQEMQLVRDHLKMKSEELQTSSYLQQNFPTIFDELNARRTASQEASQDGAETPASPLPVDSDARGDEQQP